MTAKIGEVDGKVSVERVLNAIAGYYGMKSINTAALDEDIDLEVIIGPGALGIDAFNTTVADGNILVKDINNEASDYVTIPIKASLRCGPVARFQHIKKTGSIATLTLLYQMRNQ
jgi:hypothetical protein